ncbi:hypothetical protein SAMN04487926_11912 [Paraburkholderia steynii]|uniref:Uncharacterized protein n=1 Tax=Paraburkholderia steynii TaxID=1245441 RepID=A0A7Z7FJH1_9BURK|nr:hypothetical protein [Paraburkholderia steynii]SDI55105.1 hypothetical protein SAMN04487926_11912 [Paraburkholderia steynii]
MVKNIYVAYGPDGTILAASGSKHPSIPGRTEGVVVDEFEVPSKFHSKDMHEYIPHVVVDVRARKLREK